MQLIVCKPIYFIPISLLPLIKAVYQQFLFPIKINVEKLEWSIISQWRTVRMFVLVNVVEGRGNIVKYIDVTIVPFVTVRTAVCYI